MSAGRPAYYETAELLQEGIDGYFNHIKGEKIQSVLEDGTIMENWIRMPEPATITGLALFLGFNDRQSLYDYQAKEEFSCIVKKARTLVECEYEKRLAGQSPTGAIFALKNMGWKDKQEVEHVNERFMLIEKEPDDRNEQIPD